MSAARVVGFAVLVLAMPAARAQSLGGSAGVDVGALAEARQQAHARLDKILRDAEAAHQQITQLEAALARAVADRDAAVARHGAAWTDLNAVISARDRALWELSQGLFCSRCNNSRSELCPNATSDYEAQQCFEAHLTSVQGTGIPAPPEVVQRKTQEWDQKVAAAQNRVNQMWAAVTAANQRIQDVENKLRVARDDFHAARRLIGPAYLMWLEACRDEFRGREKLFLAEDFRRRLDLAALRAAHEALNEALRWQLPPAGKAQLTARRTTVVKQAELALAGIRRERRSFIDRARSWRETASAQAESFRQRAERIGHRLAHPSWPPIQVHELDVSLPSYMVDAVRSFSLPVDWKDLYFGVDGSPVRLQPGETITPQMRRRITGFCMDDIGFEFCSGIILLWGPRSVGL